MKQRNTRKALQASLQKRIAFLEAVIDEKTNDLTGAPSGSLRCSMVSGRERYYHVTPLTGSDGSYIRRKDMHMAHMLAQKEYDRKVLDAARCELDMIRKAEIIVETGSAETVYSRLPACRRELVEPVILRKDRIAETWMDRSYVRKGFLDDAPDYITRNGERVRSKSEILIADALSERGIPYYYEYPLFLPEVGLIHPDFLVLSDDGDEIIWEHLGLMDDPVYIAAALRRIDI